MTERRAQTDQTIDRRYYVTPGDCSTVIRIHRADGKRSHIEIYRCEELETFESYLATALIWAATSSTDDEGSL